MNASAYVACVAYFMAGLFKHVQGVNRSLLRWDFKTTSAQSSRGPLAKSRGKRIYPANYAGYCVYCLAFLFLRRYGRELKINHGHRYFVQMLRRGESGTSGLIGQTQPHEANVFTQRERTQAQAQERGKGKILITALVFALAFTQ